MANLCSFELHARVKIANENSLLDMKKRFWFDENGFSKKFDPNDPEAKPENRFSVIEAHLDEYKLENGYYIMQIWGECKWSVFSSFYYELKEWALNHDIDIQIYSEENNCGFQEYFEWRHGEATDYVVKDMFEFHVDDITDGDEEDVEFIFENKLCKEANCTKDNYQSFADDDGYIKFGGFNNWDFKF